MHLTFRPAPRDPCALRSQKQAQRDCIYLFNWPEAKRPRRRGSGRNALDGLPRKRLGSPTPWFPDLSPAPPSPSLRPWFQAPTSAPNLRPRSQLPIQAPASSLAQRISTATLPNVLILRLVTQPSFLEIDSRELIPRRTASEDSPRSHRRILAFVRKIRRDHAHPQARHRRPQASSPE